MIASASRKRRKTLELITANVYAQVRTELLAGRTYLVAPLAMINPGVLSGSRGALFYPPDEVRKNPQAWNHIPLVLDHPTVNGVPVSARSPQILEKYGLGYVFNSEYNGKLRAEGWFDVERTKRIAPEVFKSLNANKPIELSTGLFTDNEKAPEGASYNGRSYAFVARNYRPDHLAILPGKTGACSCKDGCGVLVNQSTDDLEERLELVLQPSLVELQRFSLVMNEGRWITTDRGKHIFIEGGRVTKGNIGQHGGGSSRGSSDDQDEPEEKKSSLFGKVAKFGVGAGLGAAGTIGGEVAGASLGGTVGGALGGIFGAGAGAVPGAAVGSFVGGIAGGMLGHKAAKTVSSAVGGEEAELGSTIGGEVAGFGLARRAFKKGSGALAKHIGKTPEKVTRGAWVTKKTAGQGGKAAQLSLKQATSGAVEKAKSQAKHWASKTPTSKVSKFKVLKKRNRMKSFRQMPKQGAYKPAMKKTGTVPRGIMKKKKTGPILKGKKDAAKYAQATKEAALGRKVFHGAGDIVEGGLAGLGIEAGIEEYKGHKEPKMNLNERFNKLVGNVWTDEMRAKSLAKRQANARARAQALNVPAATISMPDQPKKSKTPKAPDAPQPVTPKDSPNAETMSTPSTPKVRKKSMTPDAIFKRRLKKLKATSKGMQSSHIEEAYRNSPNRQRIDQMKPIQKVPKAHEMEDGMDDGSPAASSPGKRAGKSKDPNSGKNLFGESVDRTRYPSEVPHPRKTDRAAYEPGEGVSLGAFESSKRAHRAGSAWSHGEAAALHTKALSHHGFQSLSHARQAKAHAKALGYHTKHAVVPTARFVRDAVETGRSVKSIIEGTRGGYFDESGYSPYPNGAPKRESFTERFKRVFDL